MDTHPRITTHGSTRPFRPRRLMAACLLAGAAAVATAQAPASVPTRAQVLDPIRRGSNVVNGEYYNGDGSKTVAPGDFSRTSVGDDSDTSPYRAAGVKGISTGLYSRNMAQLARFVAR